ncbi:protein of unknown function DUF1080 [Fibrella aestuarina BUZ 2]|uniref:PA14 domain-containing protein n=1 Tax=Fibrella aestuarina BUZ 2 TaxID=1166018 RepID=I0K925_9BACT|nr:family 16 glycoside hydrolase [Fibrella aestuarina]CCH00628.1 protein of unknown function DUF1080 [Fibrella aestuarina BUZ 2]
MQKFLLPVLVTASGWLGTQVVFGQSGKPLPLTDLSGFRQPVPANWSLASDLNADLSKPNTLTVKPGTGILVCQPSGKYGSQFNLLTAADHGDADIELDFMMAKGANSGIYLQGRYELQLLDSWGVATPKASDVGSIYERWDERRPEGQKGYEGHPARQNAGKAPGLWQHLRISFQAPRFDASGKKTENARFLRVELNGILIHDNVEVSGPTRGPLADDEKARGPLMFQGDHGAVAFRNITITPYDAARPRLSELSYSIYKGNFRTEPSFGGLAPESKGTSPILSAAVSRIPNDFVIRYTGTLHVDQEGDYTFNTATSGGSGRLTINNQPVGNWRENNSSGKVTLPKGDLPFELLYSKFADWAGPNLELAVTGPGIRRFLLTPAGTSQDESDPILVSAETNTLLRSFMDLPKTKNAQGRTYRVTHGISVGSPEQVHYTYDADNGAIVQVWRGMFLDATPMWENRGDGSSRPMGAVSYLGAKPQLTVARLASAQAPWPADTANSGFRPKGYALDNSDRPTFRYVVADAMVNDQIRVLPDGHGLQRELTVAQGGKSLYARLADAQTIEAMPNNTYLIDGKSYFIQLNDKTAKPVVRSSNGRQELIVPIADKLTYSILF